MVGGGFWHGCLNCLYLQLSMITIIEHKLLTWPILATNLIVNENKQKIKSKTSFTTSLLKDGRQPKFVNLVAMVSFMNQISTKLYKRRT